jgi:hypothetical protein
MILIFLALFLTFELGAWLERREREQTGLTRAMKREGQDS